MHPSWGHCRKEYAETPEEVPAIIQSIRLKPRKRLSKAESVKDPNQETQGGSQGQGQGRFASQGYWMHQSGNKRGGTTG